MAGDEGLSSIDAPLLVGKSGRAAPALSLLPTLFVQRLHVGRWYDTLATF